MDARRLESVWYDQSKYELAEATYQSTLAVRHEGLVVKGKKVNSPIASISTEIGKAMDMIGKSLNNSTMIQPVSAELERRVAELEKENIVLTAEVKSVVQRLNALEFKCGVAKIPAATSGGGAIQRNDDDDDDDDDFDLFGDTDEEETAKVLEERKNQISKKSSKPPPIAKSSLILDIKPWDDETDMAAMEAEVRKIEADGLLWGASKFLPVAYGIKKLQICCVVEDEKIGTDFLEESIQEIEDYVQSMDIVAFNKI